MVWTTTVVYLAPSPSPLVLLARCTQFTIIDDTTQENNEGFIVDFDFVDGVGAHKGTVPQSMVIITDDDGTCYCIALHVLYSLFFLFGRISDS